VTLADRAAPEHLHEAEPWMRDAAAAHGDRDIGADRIGASIERLPV
jgi:hypothetical protein